MDSDQYDLLYGGGYSIKDYYMESGNPRQMRGASDLLRDCAEKVKKMLKISYNVEESDVFTGGSTLCAKVPRKEGEDFKEKEKSIVKESEDIFRTNCRTASAAFVFVEIGQEGYGASSRIAHAKYDKRRAAKFTDWSFQNGEASGWIQSKNCKSLIFGGLDDDIIKKAPARCSRCRLRDPKYFFRHDNGEEQYLCESCARREDRSCNIKYDMRIKCGSKFDCSYEIDTMSMLKDGSGRVALLYADINDLGGQALREEFEDDKKFHEDVSKAARDAIYTAIREAMDYDKAPEDKLIPAKFEIISLAGDDICLLLPGNVALLTANTIINEFDKENHLGLTISVAACVANDTTAISYMKSIVEKALKDAKERAHDTGQSAINLSFFERPSGLFPMTTDEMNDFTALLRKSSAIAVTAIRNISEARRELVFDEEFKLFLRYHLSRDVPSIKRSRSVMEQIDKKYEGLNPWHDFITWHDQKLGGDNP